MIIFNKSAIDGTQISIIGQIYGESEFANSDAAMLQSALNQADHDNINLWLTSPGGDLDAAFAMRSALENYKGEITIHTCGIVASAATILLCAKNVKVVAHRGSVFMIHLSASACYGNVNDMNKTIEMLEACDAEILKVLQIKLQCDEKEIKKMLKNETWLSVEEAKELGLVDDIVEDAKTPLAMPENVKKIDVDDVARCEKIANAVLARISPEFGAVSDKVNTLHDEIENRAKIENSAIYGDVAKTVQNALSDVQKVVDNFSKSQADTIEKITNSFNNLIDNYNQIRKDFDEMKLQFNKQSAIISDAYCLDNGTAHYSIHDECVNAKPFKLNI